MIMAVPVTGGCRDRAHDRGGRGQNDASPVSLDGSTGIRASDLGGIDIP
jgi:hypothetical protein